MEERKHIVILAAGDFPTHPVPLRALHEADFVVCCDSAYNEWKVESKRNASGILGRAGEGAEWKEGKPFAVIGDGDSLSPCDKCQLGDRWIQVSEQDYNDFHKAMDWATSNFPLSTSHFQLLGATGKREDHTLGNISYLATFAEEHPGADIEMLTDHGRFVAMRGGRTYAGFPGQQVSIFAMDPAIAICSEGLRWPLDNFHARRWWQASLNEVLGDSFTLTAEDWLVVFQTYEPKA